jgi:cytochrome c
MNRLALGAALLLSLAACGKAARESDDPLPAATPETSNEQTGSAVAAASTASAVAAASTASAAEPPAAFMQCKVCHSTEAGQTLIGPSLAGVYGRSSGSLATYSYSTAMRQAGLTWDDASLDRYLQSPMTVVPGTKMTFAGLKDQAARQEVIAFLKTL